ncbi:Carboxylesterase family-domain-containing protein [Chiua virens]|nr:Carboxylesterase family-domain-containing protein [Chiua virens]
MSPGLAHILISLTYSTLLQPKGLKFLPVLEPNEIDVNAVQVRRVFLFPSFNLPTMILDRCRVSLHHSSLDTTFHGIQHPVSSLDIPIHQFRGIKYAVVPARFRQSIICSSYPPEVDATKHGPICPQASQRSLEEELIGLSETDIPRQVFLQDEFECLNLNITTPAHHTSHSRLPVMVWVHGGGNHGCGSSWVYDGGPLVAASVRMGKPVVLVTFNFRLGFFGCAASPKLAEDNRAAGDLGVGNYGLRDQRRALKWVNHYIADFGGDPSNVTIFGSGSGAADIIGHLYSNPNKTDPLFARAIIQSAIVEHTVSDITTAEISCPIRAVDDGVFFRAGWRDSLFPPAAPEDTEAPARPSVTAHRLGVHKGKSRSPHPQGRTAPPPAMSGLQPLIIGDTALRFRSLEPSSFWLGRVWCRPPASRHLSIPEQSDCSSQRL